MNQTSTFEQHLEESHEFGVVQLVQHPLAIVAGLPTVALSEIVVFENGALGEVFSLENDIVEVLVFSKEAVRVNMKVTKTNTTMSVPVGKELLGCAIDPLGNAISNVEKYFRPDELRPIESKPPGIMKRARVKNPFFTGVTVVDMMVPLGKGQKELVIGDRKTGKSSFLLGTLKNQIGLGAIAIYAAIGKKKSDIKRIQEFFDREKLTEKTIIVATTSYDSPTLIYLTPYAAMTIAEYFRDQGQDVVIILDDLSTHAKFYREMSLLAKKFPGRDSYPGDIFYTHARLLERVGNFKHGTGEVSITALPVVEIVEGDFTGYIATNLMGMTDGHIYFDSNIYYRGRRPAVNIGLSVTRVGRQSQTNLVRSINREITAFLALYEKMQNLSHFGAELTDSVKQVLATGEMIYEFFNQQYTVVIPQQVQLILFSVLWLKLFDDTSVENINMYRDNMIKAYYNEDVRLLFAEMMKSQSFNELLSAVSSRKEDLGRICKIETNS